MAKYIAKIAFRATQDDIKNIERLRDWIQEGSPTSFKITNSDVIRYALEQLGKQASQQGMQSK